MSTQSARKTEAFGCRQPWRALGAYRGAGESGGGETKRAGGGGEGRRPRAGKGEAERAGRWEGTLAAVAFSSATRLENGDYLESE